MRERQCGIGREGAQDVSGGLVMQVVETAPQGLPIQGDHAQALPSSPVIQTTSMMTEGGLEVGWVERQDEVAQGVESRRAAEAGPEDLVQALTVQADERDDALVGGCTCQDGQDGEEKQVWERVAFALTPARVSDVLERSQQSSIGEHSGLRRECRLSLCLRSTPGHASDPAFPRCARFGVRCEPDFGILYKEIVGISGHGNEVRLTAIN